MRLRSQQQLHIRLQSAPIGKAEAQRAPSSRRAIHGRRAPLSAGARARFIRAASSRIGLSSSGVTAPILGTDMCGLLCAGTSCTALGSGIKRARHMGSEAASNISMIRSSRRSLPGAISSIRRPVKLPSASNVSLLKLGRLMQVAAFGTMACSDCYIRTFDP